MPNKFILSLVLVSMLLTAATDAVAGTKQAGQGGNPVSGLDLGSTR